MDSEDQEAKKSAIAMCNYMVQSMKFIFQDTSTPATNYFALSDLEETDLHTRLAKQSEYWRCEAEIKKRASLGFKYARYLEQSMAFFKPACEALDLLMSIPKTPQYSKERKNLEKSVIQLFACSFRMSELVVTFSFDAKIYLHDLARSMYRKLSKNNDYSALEVDIHICYTFCSFIMSPASAYELALTGIRKYPQETFFYDKHCEIFGFLGKFKDGIKAAEKFLKVFPNSYELLFIRAAMMKHLQRERPYGRPIYNFGTVVDAHLEFLKHAPQDHRHKPDIFYSLAEILITTKRTLNQFVTGERSGGTGNLLHSQVRKYYQDGLQAERYLLSCFLPYELSNSKLVVELFLRVSTVIPPEYNKIQLTDVKRSTEIQEYRQFLQSNPVANFSKLKVGESCTNKDGNESPNVKVKGEESTEEELEKLEPIELWNMDRNEDRIYDGRCIKLTVIEDTLFDSLEYVQTLVEDTNAEVIRCVIYGLTRQLPSVEQRVGYGSRITVMNPYLHLPKDSNTKACIRVDDPENIVFHLEEKLEKRCRFCGKDGAIQRCGKCKRANYCSKKCQVQDWKILKHKLICHE